MENNTLVTAAFAHFEAKRLEALARLQLYGTNSVGVGDHSNVVEESIRAIEDLDNAVSCLQTLQSLVANNEEQ